MYVKIQTHTLLTTTTASSSHDVCCKINWDISGQVIFSSLCRKVNQKATNSSNSYQETKISFPVTLEAICFLAQFGGIKGPPVHFNNDVWREKRRPLDQGDGRRPTGENYTKEEKGSIFLLLFPGFLSCWLSLLLHLLLPQLTLQGLPGLEQSSLFSQIDFTSTFCINKRHWADIFTELL